MSFRIERSFVSTQCNFAHGDTEIRVKDFVPSKYKTKLCLKFTKEGYCAYG